MRAWSIYEITTEGTIIHGVMFRGRLRKFAILNDIELLTENASDLENAVRFAMPTKQQLEEIIVFIKSITNDAKVELILEDVKNPVLSKLNINKEERYTLD